MAVDLARALEDWGYFESIVDLDDPIVTLLKRAGAFAYDHFETIDLTDWNGAIVGRGPGPLLRPAIPLDPSLPFSELEVLLSQGVRARGLVAMHPSTPLSALLTLAEDPAHEVQLTLLKNERCGSAVLERLCRSPLQPVREACTTDARLTPELIELLLADPAPQVRARIVWRKDLDVATLGRIYASDPGQGEGIAGHPNATAALLELLARSTSLATRAAVVANPLTPADALELIWSQEQNARIRRGLASHHATPAALLNELVKDRELRLLLARRRELPAEAQLCCARDPNIDVRVAVAQNGTEQGALSLLLKDSSASVRAALALNPAWHALEDLALDEMSPVRRNVAGRADAPRELLELLATDSQSEVSRVAARTLASMAK